MDCSLRSFTLVRTNLPRVESSGAYSRSKQGSWKSAVCITALILKNTSLRHQFLASADIAGDLWLICSPVYLLWNVKLNNRRQILIFSVFASDLLVTVASVIHGVHILQQKPTAIVVSANVEVGLELFFLPVMLTEDLSKYSLGYL